jgi:drug/metabolite transporter (DMT)-like permease
MPVKPPSRQSPTGPLGLDPLVLGTAFCILAALGYSAANVCLRYLAVQDNRVLTICVKESVTVAVVGPWLVYWAWRGVRLMPAWKALAALLAAGLFVQLGGNLPVIWAMNVVGLAVAIPVALGVNLVASAAFGRMFLSERVSRRSMAAIALLIVSLVLLSVGAVSSKTTEPGEPGTAAAGADPPRFGPVAAVVATAGACLTGIAFATLAVVIRRSVTTDVSPYAVMFVITGAGVVSLGPISLATLGAQGIAATPARDVAVMLASGVFNLIAFFAIIKGLQLTTVVHANVLNASQVAIAAVAGMVLFSEPAAPAKLIGVCLTVAGMILIDRPVGAEETVAELESRP